GGLHPVLATWHAWGYTGRLQDERFSWEPAEVRGAQGIRWQGIRASADLRLREFAGTRLAVSYLTSGESNVVAAVLRLENRSPARVTGRLDLSTFVRPGGDRAKRRLYVERDGALHHQRRVHGGGWGGTVGWSAVAAPEGPVLALVVGTPGGSIDLRDMGLEGAHPQGGAPFDLAPGEATETVAYVVLAGDVEEARRYRVLASTGALV